MGPHRVPVTDVVAVGPVAAAVYGTASAASPSETTRPRAPDRTDRRWEDVRAIPIRRPDQEEQFAVRRPLVRPYPTAPSGLVAAPAVPPTSTR
jgi:hypothetical protein